MFESSDLKEILRDSPDVSINMDEIVNILQTSGIESVEGQVAILIKNMLKYFNKKAASFPNIDELPENEKLEIMNKIRRISASVLNKNITDKEMLIQSIIYGMLLAIGEIFEKKQEELLKEKGELLTKEEKEELEKSMLYELYKIMNPNRVAGETELENYINNIVTRGKEIANRYSSNEPKTINIGNIGIKKTIVNSKDNFVQKYEEIKNDVTTKNRTIQ